MNNKIYYSKSGLIYKYNVIDSVFVGILEAYKSSGNMHFVFQMKKQKSWYSFDMVNGIKIEFKYEFKN
jgi:hypothetical protein